MRTLPLIFFVSATALADDPLSAELAACETFCDAIDQPALGLRAAPFEGGVYRACVCAAQAGQEAPALKQPPAAPTAPKEAEPEAAEVIRPKAAPAPIDCDSPQVQACLTKAKRMANRTYVPIDGLPTLTPASGEFNVTIVEISDYECPFCRRVQSTLEQIRTQQGGDIRFVFVNNPLAFHKRAEPAARAVLAAQRQGGFWAYHKKLMKKPGDLSDRRLEALALETGLDLKRFRADLADPALAQEVARQKELARSRGARGTPGFFINGRRLRGAQPIRQFLRLIDAARADAKRLRQRGLTDSEAIYRELTQGKPHQPAQMN